MLCAGDVRADDIDLMELDPLIGRDLDERWIVLEAIARGGMGTVYRGVHIELGREAAIKVLSPAYARSDEAVLRFLREARTTARIDHPNIVAILDLGRLEGEAPYLVMELLEGEDLADLIAREAPVSLGRTLELLAPIARALDAVHAAGLLHRDVKPANIFLAQRPDGSVSPTLIDFGLAALRQETDEDRLTRDGIVVGTPHYVSPEAAEGDPIDVRADVYSLGLVAYELLTGVLPIDGAEAGALLVQKVRRPAPTMSHRTGASYPPALEQLIARTLSRTPAKRPASAGAFIEALEALAGEDGASPVSAPRVEAAPQSVDPSARQSSAPSLPRVKRRVGLASAAVVASAVALVAWAPWSDDGIVARPLARIAPHEDPAPSTPLRSAAAHPAPEERRSPSPSTRPRSATRRSPPASPPVVEPLRARSATAPRVSPLESPLERAPDLDRASTLVREGGAALLRGRFPRARELFREATEIDDTHAAAWRGLGLASERMGMAPEAARAYRRYLALASDAQDSDRVRERLASLTERRR